MPIRVVFMGSPDFSLPTLRKLAEHYLIVGVVTQPDRPAGRGMVLTPPPVKVLAEKLNLRVIQPQRLREPWVWDTLVQWQPDMIVVAAFGQILRQNVIDLPRFGCINVHASYLPRWRGASPVQAAILSGDTSTGVTIMKMDAGVDTGSILAQRKLEIIPGENAGQLGSRLSDMGAELLLDTLPDYVAGKLPLIPQDPTLATYAAMLKKEDGLLNFHLSSSELSLKIRAFNPWPGAYTLWQNQPVKIQKAHTIADVETIPEKRAVIHGLPAIGTSNGWLVIDELQPAGKKSMPGEVFLRGARHWESTD